MKKALTECRVLALQPGHMTLLIFAESPQSKHRLNCYFTNKFTSQSPRHVKKKSFTYYFLVSLTFYLNEIPVLAVTIYQQVMVEYMKYTYLTRRILNNQTHM